MKKFHWHYSVPLCLQSSFVYLHSSILQAWLYLIYLIQRRTITRTTKKGQEWMVKMCIAKTAQDVLVCIVFALS